MEKTVRLVFKGELQPGRSLAEVKAALPDALKIPPERVDGLFRGEAVVIKRGLPESRLAAYLDFLTKAGICVEIEDEQAALVLEPIGEPVPASRAASSETEEMVCLQCGARQPKRTLCRECGVDMPRYAAAQATLRSQATPPAVASTPAMPASAPSFYDEEVPPIFGFGFHGRLNRMRYLIYGLALYAVLIVALLLVAGSMFASMFNDGFPILSILFFGVVLLATMFFGFRYSVQRLHDMGLTGWLVLLSFVPVIGGLVWFWLLVWPGNKESNEYGPPSPPNSTLHQVIALGLIVLMVVLVAIGFSKAVSMQGDMMRAGPMHMQITPEPDDEAPRREQM